MPCRTSKLLTASITKSGIVFEIVLSKSVGLNGFIIHLLVVGHNKLYLLTLYLNVAVNL